jgi:hypothetical protein
MSDTNELPLCLNCSRQAIAVTVDTIVGPVSVCKICGIQGGNPEFLQAVEDTLKLEIQWSYLGNDALAKAERGY